MSIAPLHGFMGYVAGFPDIILALLLLGLSLALAFAGKHLIKALAFVISGLVIGTVGATLGASYLGAFGALLGAAVGFVAGGFLGIMIVVLGIGVAVGYVGYSIASVLFGNELVSLLAGLAMFVIGIILADKLLEVATAILGGLLLFNVMTSMGAGFEVGAVSAFVVTILGIWTQTRGPTSHSKETKTVSAAVQ